VVSCVYVVPGEWGPVQFRPSEDRGRQEFGPGGL
jgi:hypothetical protein